MLSFTLLFEEGKYRYKANPQSCRALELDAKHS